MNRHVLTIGVTLNRKTKTRQTCKIQSKPLLVFALARDECPFSSHLDSIIYFWKTKLVSQETRFRYRLQFQKCLYRIQTVAYCMSPSSTPSVSTPPDFSSSSRSSPFSTDSGLADKDSSSSPWDWVWDGTSKEHLWCQ